MLDRTILDSDTVYHVASWLMDAGYLEAGDAVMGLISEYDPDCKKPCCLELSQGE